MSEMIPSIPPYGRQLFICVNGNCIGKDEATALLQQLNALHRKHGRHRFSHPERISHVPCGCLGVCTSGPILIVYPDGIWYHSVDETRLRRIYQEHLIEGNPVEEFIFHRHFPPGEEPAYAPDLRRSEEIDPLLLAAEEAAASKEEKQHDISEEVLPPHVAAARARRRGR